MTEQEAIQELKIGHAPAIETIIHTYEKRVYNIVLNIVQRIEDAEEITQDVFVKVVHTISSFKGEAAFSTWLYRVAVNEALSFLRKQKSKKRWHFLQKIFLQEDSLERLHVDFEHPGALHEHKEDVKKIYAAIQQLPERQKIAFTLRHIEQLSQKEIAQIMDCKVGAVESLITRAKQQLQQNINIH